MTQSRNFVFGGLQIALRHWPAFVWTYVFNLGLAVLFSIRLHGQLSAITAHSFAAQRLSGAFDLGTAASVGMKLSEGPNSNGPANFLSVPIYLLLYFVLVPGTLFCYQTDAPARLSTLLQAGVAHFWRFVRITLISLVVFALVLGPLLALQKAWAAHVDNTVVGRSAALHELAGVVAIGLVAAFLRVYFDLIEVYTVQLGRQVRPADYGKAAIPDKRVRRTYLPAWRTYRQYFLRAWVAFILLALLGMSAVVITARIAMHSLAQPRVWPVFLLLQTGLFLMMFTRFWQRGAETVLALRNPIPTEKLSSPVISPVVLYPEPSEAALPPAEVVDPSPGD